MAALGWHVTAVEPGRAMLDVLRARAADDGLPVATAQGTAEATGLDAASVDLATAAQAFHWFDKPAALAEMARIVRPGGGLALFWNVRDETRSPFVAADHATLDRHGGAGRGPLPPGRPRAGRSATRQALEASLPSRRPRSTSCTTRSGCAPTTSLPMTFTASYVRAMAPESQRGFRAETSASSPSTRRPMEGSTIPYRIDCWIARRSTP